MKSKPRVSVIMRTRNSDWVVGQALKGLYSQGFQDFELLVVDSGSTDRTVDIVTRYPCRTIQIPASDYVPGTVLNMAIEAAHGDILVFQNSDVVPLHGRVLASLLAPLDDPEVAATFARQVPRPEAHLWVRRDYAASFPKVGPAPQWISLSLPLAAIRRSALQLHPFYEDAWASEDTEWGCWARDHGLRVEYVPEAVVMHSHNYTLREIYGRRFVEGEADAFIKGQGPNFPRALARFVRSCLSDLSWHLTAKQLLSLPMIPIRRAVFHFAHHRGLTFGANRQARGDWDIKKGQQVALSRYKS